jgi:UDP-2-acetamido-3-amino-2,3-dideoxy-glucuronate N-acetyltransferase
MNSASYPSCRIHPTALIEDNVTLGTGSSVWDNVHIRHGARIGESCIIGEKTYIAYDVAIGNFCKLNASVYICAGVTIRDYVMLAAHTVFTNDRFPRAFDRTLDGLASSDPNEETLETIVGTGVTTGANVTIGPGLTIGDFAMIGMGSVVTRDVPAHALIIGNPGHLAGYVCACGPVLVRLPQYERDSEGQFYTCEKCGRVYAKSSRGITEIGGVTKQHAGGIHVHQRVS